jgi:hypothetical protein
LCSIGIPKDSVIQYEAALKADKFLVLAHGAMDEVSQARNIQQNTHPLQMETRAVQQDQPALVTA